VAAKDLPRIPRTISVGTLYLVSRQVGYRRDLAFYTVHGDLFAYRCGIITLGIVAATVWASLRRH
jgi:hypothetical protein